jgi:hypothetical protein
MLGSIAVFLTLGYLAMQVGHARREMQRSTSQSRSEGIRDMFMARLANERLTAANLKVQRALSSPSVPFVPALIERTSVTEDETYILHWEQFAWWQDAVQSVRNVNELSEVERTAWERNIRRAYSGNNHSTLWYETMKGALNADAVRYIDSLFVQRG